MDRQDTESEASQPTDNQASVSPQTGMYPINGSQTMVLSRTKPTTYIIEETQLKSPK